MKTRFSMVLYIFHAATVNFVKFTMFMFEQYTSWAETQEFNHFFSSVNYLHVKQFISNGVCHFTYSFKGIVVDLNSTGTKL